MQQDYYILSCVFLSIFSLFRPRESVIAKPAYKMAFFFSIKPFLQTIFINACPDSEILTKLQPRLLPLCQRFRRYRLFQKGKGCSPHGHARVSKLKHYKPPHGFADAIIFTDSVALFNALWEEWLNTKLYLMVKDAPLLEKDIKALLGSL